MARPRHLRKAPIREALVDIAVKTRPGTSIQALEALYEDVRDEFSGKQEIRTAEVEVNFAQETNRLTNTIIGYAFRASDDNNRVVQFRLNGFTCNWLKPYSEWVELKSLAQRMWRIYAARIQPEHVTRLGLRFINQLELPVPRNDFNEYLTAQPNVPPALPQSVMSFFTRIAFRNEATDCFAVVTQASEGLVKPDVFPLILDIDTSKVGQWEPNSDEIWQCLDQLRDFKNLIFFESLTEEAVRIFE